MSDTLVITSKTARQISKPALIICWISELCSVKLHYCAPTLHWFPLWLAVFKNKSSAWILLCCFWQRAMGNSFFLMNFNYGFQIKPLAHKVNKREFHWPWKFVDVRIIKYSDALGTACEIRDGLEIATFKYAQYSSLIHNRAHTDCSLWAFLASALHILWKILKLRFMLTFKQL